MKLTDEQAMDVKKYHAMQTVEQICGSENMKEQIMKLLLDRQALKEDVETYVRYGEEYRHQLNQAIEVLKEVANISSADGAGRDMGRINMIVNEFINPASLETESE